jgi:ATP-binding cassette subfamily B protein
VTISNSSDNLSEESVDAPQAVTEPVAAAPKKMSTLLSLVQFFKPYKLQVWVFLTALVFTAGITLSVGQGLRMVIDQGFAQQSLSHLNQAIMFIVIASVLMAMGTYVRFYLISWLGERVTADLRKAVFNHIVALHPAFFETNRSGDIMSRLTSDTTLLQSIIGSSASIALRSAISFTGALIMLLVTNFKLSLMIIVARYASSPGTVRILLPMSAVMQGKLFSTLRPCRVSPMKNRKKPPSAAK